MCSSLRSHADVQVAVRIPDTCPITLHDDPFLSTWYPVISESAKPLHMSMTAPLDS